LDYWKSQLAIGVRGYQPFNPVLYAECKNIAQRLAADHSVQDADALVPNSADKDFGLLAKSIQQSIDKGEMEQALDRLHTFVVKYLRQLAAKRGLSYDKKTPLNALIGAYVKWLRDSQLIESEMSLQILRSSIKVFEAFDGVRNNQSLAHDNPLLNREESLLIFSHVSSSIRFLESIEKKITEKRKRQGTPGLTTDVPAAEIEVAFEEYAQHEIDRRLGK
jgi:hypothetical protein